MSVRIYVASLASYNAGVLDGKWIELDESMDADDIGRACDAVVKASKVPGEEWAIHDYEGFGDASLGEHPDLEELAKVTSVLCMRGSVPRAALSALINHHPEDWAKRVGGYCGAYDKDGDYAYERAVDSGDALGVYADHIDWESVERELDLSDEIDKFVIEGVRYVFCGVE